MKRILSNVIVIIMLISIFSNSIVIAESKEKYYNVQIPIFQGNTKEFSTELLNGITTAQEEEKGIVFVSIEDFKKLTNIEIVKKSNNTITLKRNTVYLELQIDNNNAVLSLGYDENNVIKSFDVEVSSIKYKNNIYISLIHGLNSFGIEMNIINKENFSNMISMNGKVLDEKCVNESISYLNNNEIFDFSAYPNYLHISSSEPFDNFFLEYYNDNVKYMFSWESLFMLNNVTASLGSIPSNFIYNYEGLTDFILGGYEADKRYYDILCTIINNESTKENPIDISYAYNTIDLLFDSGAIENIIDINDALSFTISSVSDLMKATEKTVNLFQCSEFQDNVLDKTLLISDKLKEEMIDDKIITDAVNMSLFNKYNNNNYLTSLYNNQYALYMSADKLNKDIGNPANNVTYDMYKDLIYKALTSVGDYALDSVTVGATVIPDLLMKNIKYNNSVNNLILAPSETVGQVKDCYFIQDTAKSMCDLNIFDEPENTYYNLRLILQSSLTAYELLSNNESLLNIIGEKGQKSITEKIENINSFLSDIEKCDISFYSTDNISDEIEKINEISIMIVPLEEETTPSEPVEIEIKLDNIDNYFAPEYTNKDFLEFNNLFLACQYNQPSEIDLNTILYHGFGNINNEITSEERSTLSNYLDSNLIKEIGLTKIDESELNDYLKNKTGLTIEKFNNDLNYTYVEKYKAYYCYHKTDTIVIFDLNFKSVKKSGNNLYKAIYTYGNKENIEYEVEFKVVNGILQFISNKEKNIENIDETENSLEFTYKEDYINSLSSDGTLVYTTSAKYPIFEGENAEVLNNEIQNSIILEGLYQEDCDKLLEDWKELQFALPTYDKYEFTVTYNQNGYVSIIEFGANNGGYTSSIYYFYTSFIYDINAKRLVEYSDFFDMNEEELQQLVFLYSDLSSNEMDFYSIETATLTQDGMKFYISDGPHAKRIEITIPYSDSHFKLIEKTNSPNTLDNTGTVKIDDGYLNVRESPSTKGKIIGKLYNDDEITIEETSEDGKWLKISKGDIKGYVSSDYISKNKTITMEDFIKGVNCYVAENLESKAKISRNFTYEENGCFFSEIRTENNDSPIIGLCKGYKDTGNVEIWYDNEKSITFSIYDYLS